LEGEKYQEVALSRGFDIGHTWDFDGYWVDLGDFVFAIFHFWFIIYFKIKNKKFD